MNRHDSGKTADMDTETSNAIRENPNRQNPFDEEDIPEVMDDDDDIADLLRMMRRMREDT